MPFNDHSVFNFYRDLYLSSENVYRYLIIPRNDCSYVLHFSGGMVISTCPLLGSGLTPDCNITSPKNGRFEHQNRQLSLLGIKLACLLILRASSSVALWSLPMVSNLAVKISFTMPDTIRSSWNSSSIFL